MNPDGTNLPTIGAIIETTSCPTCKSTAGAYCVTPKGIETYIHKSRVTKANKAATR